MRLSVFGSLVFNVVYTKRTLGIKLAVGSLRYLNNSVHLLNISFTCFKN